MPLSFDLPMERLRTYSGTNPCPADFDAYWDRGLAEVASLDPKIILVPAEFQTTNAACYHMYFTGVGGARLHAKLLQPKNAPAPHPAVLMFHYYGGNSGDWAEKLSYVSQGYVVVALDCRGQNGMSEDHGTVMGNTLQGHIIRGLHDAVNGRSEKLLYRQIFLDTALLARIVLEMPDVNAQRVAVTGSSQGGALAIACAALEPRIQKAGVVYPYLSDYQRAWQMDLGKAAYYEIIEYFRNFDPMHRNEAAVFINLGYIDIQHLANRIHADVFWAIGLMDNNCPPSTQFAVYNKISACKNMLIYPDFGHEALPGVNDQMFTYLMDL